MSFRIFREHSRAFRTVQPRDPFFPGKVLLYRKYRKENNTHMAINPMEVIKLKEKLNAFRNRHPGFSGFIGAVRRSGLPEGSVLEMKVTTPEGRTMETNFRVSEEDIDLIRLLASLRQ